jgi:hypothetical protein
MSEYKHIGRGNPVQSIEHTIKELRDSGAIPSRADDTFKHNEDAILYVLHGHEVSAPNYNEATKRLREERKRYTFGLTYGRMQSFHDEIFVPEPWEDAEVVEDKVLLLTTTSSTPRKRKLVTAVKVFTAKPH